MNFKQAARLVPYMTFKLMKKCHEEYRYEAYRQRYEISPSFQFNGWDILFYGDGRIVFGEGSYIGRGSSIESANGYLVQIGKECAISHNVRIYTSSNIADQDFSNERKSHMGSVVIQDYVWIGANVFINPGITVGANSIVGANSVLTHDVDPWSIVGGVPARLIRTKRVEGAVPKSIQSE